MKWKPSGEIYDIPTERIAVFKGQPRSYFNKEAMNRLEMSIRQIGQKRPGSVRLLFDDDERHSENIDCELIDGERRYRVCKKIGITFRAFIENDVLDEKAQFLDSVILNWGGEEHTELENFRAILRIRKDHPEYTLAQTAAAFNHSESWIEQYLSLKKLAPDVLKMMDRELPDSKRLKFGQALALVGYDHETQRTYAKLSTSEGLKTKQVKEIVERNVGKIRHISERLPSKEYEKCLNFLQRTTIDLGLMLRRPKEYFEKIFEHRDARDLVMVVKTVERSIRDLTIIAETLNRTGTVLAKRRAG